MGYKLGHRLKPLKSPWANYHGSSGTALTYKTMMPSLIVHIDNSPWTIRSVLLRTVVISPWAI